MEAMLNFDGRSPIILIVDDEPLQRLMLRRAMQDADYTIVEVHDGNECLEQCERQRPDLILLDALMPVLDGFDCCQRLTQTYGDRCPPILMITGLEDEEFVNRAFAAGAIDYVTKPINWAVLRQRVRWLLKTSWAMLRLEQMNQELHQLATIDALTQLANRRAFDECLDYEWRHLARLGSPLSLLMCDIDAFKLYNDTYGHQAGDVCLRQVAAILQTAAQRPADLVARYGGEEFALILPYTDGEGALHVAEQLRSAIQAAALPHPTSPIAPMVTLSFGAACLIPHNEAMPQTLISEADRALYQAKLQGRNCVVLAQSVQV